MVRPGFHLFFHSWLDLVIYVPVLVGFHLWVVKATEARKASLRSPPRELSIARWLRQMKKRMLREYILLL